MLVAELIVELVVDELVEFVEVLVEELILVELLVVEEVVSTDLVWLEQASKVTNINVDNPKHPTNFIGNFITKPPIL